MSQDHYLLLGASPAPEIVDFCAHLVPPLRDRENSNFGVPLAPLGCNYFTETIDCSFIVAAQVAAHEQSQRPHHLRLAACQQAQNLSHLVLWQRSSCVVHRAGMLAAA